MDVFAHALFVFVFGQAFGLDVNAQIILMISSVILDIDAVPSIVWCWENWFQFHRGPLHSFLGALLVSFAIGTAYAVFMSLPAKSFISIVSICLCGSFSHIFLDLLTPRSIAVLWPFSNEKIAFDLTYFVDPAFLLVLLLASISVVYVRNDVKMIQIVTIVAVVLLTLNFGVRYYERNAAIETVKVKTVDPNSQVVPLPTLRPDRWWVAVKTHRKKVYNYEIYSVDSIDNRILSLNSVQSPRIKYEGGRLDEHPSHSPQEAVAYSKRDKRINAFIEKSRLPAVEVTISDDGSTWQVFWYDVFTQLSEGEFRGITVEKSIEKS